MALVRHASSLCFELCIAGVFCLPPTPIAAQQFTFRHYDQGDGLSNLSVSSTLQDRSGFLWIGSEGALPDMMTPNFVNYSRAQGLPGTIVSSMTQDAKGQIWVGTTDGLAVQQKGRFHAIFLNGKPIRVSYNNALSSAPDGSVYVRIAEDILAILMNCQLPVLDGFEATAEIRAWEAHKPLDAALGKRGPSADLAASGESVVRAFSRADTRRSPIIALTFNAFVGERTRCLEAVMDDYLSTPITIEALQSTLEQWTATAQES